jgi:threonine aldolase
MNPLAETGLPGWKLQFASDNAAGACPEALAAFNAANSGWAASYGNDDWTQAVCDRLRSLFETDCEVFFVFNGTAANSLALASLCQSYHSVICADCAHVETDECGAPEFFSNGTKLLLAQQVLGRLQPEAIADLITRRSDIHYPRPRVVSLTQSTEYGTVYRVEEIAEIAQLCHRRGLKVHMDGARFANAVAALGASPAEATWRAGVDVLCFGGTKMGLPLGEAIVFFDRDLATEFAYRCKQAGQLASKMRYLSAPWLAVLENDVWLRRARHANAMASRLAGRMAGIAGIALPAPAEANAVFATLPRELNEGLQAKGWAFYTFIGGGARFMCSWNTQESAIDALVSDLESLVAG